MALIKSGLGAVLMMLMVVMSSGAARVAEAAVSCQQAVGIMAPCLGYLTSGGAVSVACCNGARTLSTLCRNKSDCKQICSCVQQFARLTPGFSYPYAAALPAKCGVVSPYVISPKTDCSRT